MSEEKMQVTEEWDKVFPKSDRVNHSKKKAMNAQRTEDYKNGSYALAGGVVDPLPEDAPQFVKAISFLSPTRYFPV